MGRGDIRTQADRQRMKLRCKTLLQSMQSDVLRNELTRLTTWTHREAKTDDIALFELTVSRATEQQHYHKLQSETVLSNGGATRKEARPPPAAGCLFCHGSHSIRDCTEASAEQKALVLGKVRSPSAKRQDSVRQVRSVQAGGQRSTVAINELLVTPFCPDTGSDLNLVSRTVADEPTGLGVELDVQLMVPPQVIQGAGDAMMACHAKCVILEAEEDEFVLGKPTLRSLGIDIDRFFEQLAVRNSAENDAEADDIPVDHDVWRLHVGADGPAHVEPLTADLRPGIEPCRAFGRRYTETQRTFLRKYVQELETGDRVKQNSQSHWAYPALPVQKQGTDEYHVIDDYRLVNRLTVPLAGATPNLVVAMQGVRGSYRFAELDFLKGFGKCRCTKTVKRC
ncbi:hypothetical protein FI667_g8878, partial [Globisporangium splendens]